MFQRRDGRALAASVAGLLALSTQALANVNLEWRPEWQAVLIGQTVDIRLYAVSDDETNQSIGAISAILSWDPDFLELVDIENNGPYAWAFSGFPSLSYLNDDVLDGDAYYTAFMALVGGPAYATPDGLLVATLRFVALKETSVTKLSFITWDGGDFYTRVLDGIIPGLIVTGTLGSAWVSILPCGSLGDLDVDCDVDLVDHSEFESCLTGPYGGPLEPECEAADLDGDGDVDLFDVGIFQASYTGPK